MRALQGNFNAGIIGPGMYSRGDLAKYQTGVKDAVNMVIRPEGGLFNRAGTRIVTGFGSGTPNDPPRLIPFDAGNAANRFMLEFDIGAVRVLFEQAYVLNSAVAPRAITSIIPGSGPVPVLPVLPRLVMASPADAAAFTVGRRAFVRDPNGSSILHEAIIKITGISGANISFDIVGGNGHLLVDWGTFGSGAELYEVYEFVSPYSLTEAYEIVAAQDLEDLYLAHPEQPFRVLRPTAPDNWAFSTVATEPAITAPTAPSAVPTTGTGAIAYRYKAAALDGETSEESLPSAAASCLNDLDAAAGNKNTFSWTGVAGASAYKVYKEFNGIYGYIGITQGTSFVDENIVPDTLDNPKNTRTPFNGPGNRPSFVTFVEQRLTAAASNLQPQGVEMSSSVSPRNFSRALTPGDSDAISFRPRAQKQSKVVAIVPHDEPVIFTRGGEGIVRGGDDKGYLTPTNLVLKTTTSRGSADFPKPLSIGETILHVQRDGSTIREYVPKRTDEESADLTLLARHLFRGRTIRSWAYSQSPDSVVWVTTDRGELYSMTYLPEHSVWGWTRHQLGGPLIDGVRSTVFVHQVEVLQQGADDIVYLVVERDGPGGGPVTWVEALDNRRFDLIADAFFVDAGRQLQVSVGVTTLRGFLHLRGETVSALLDGGVIEELAVSDEGRITLPESTGGTIAVGFPYAAEFTTLSVNLASQSEGDSTGALKSTARIALQIEDTRGIAVGREGGWLEELVPEVDDASIGAPPPMETGTFLFTVEGNWVVDARITVRQRHPLPMTVTGIAPDWEIGG